MAGHLQRAILGEIDRHPGQVIPVVTIASWHAQREGVPMTDHLRSSFRRAAGALAAEGAIARHEVELPTRSLAGLPTSTRKVLCVSGPGVVPVVPPPMSGARAKPSSAPPPF